MPVLLERKRPSERQLKAVRAYIMKRRKLEKQALAESKAKEEAAMQRKREQEKKKETVEDVKIEINKLEEKLESLKNEKHELFLQLKKVLLYEDEQKRQKEREMHPVFHHPMVATSVNRMPYVMVGPRPYGVMTTPPASTAQSVRMDASGGVMQPLSPMHPQGYPHPAPPSQAQIPPPAYQQPYPGHVSSSDQSHGPITIHSSQTEKQFKVTNNQATAVGNTDTSTPLHVVTSHAAAAGHQSPHSQMMPHQGEKLQSSSKLHSPKTSTIPAVPHGFQQHRDLSQIQERPLINQPTVNQQVPKHQFTHSQQITSSSNTYPKHEISHQFKQSPSKQTSYPIAYPSKAEPPQSMSLKATSSKPTPAYPKIDQTSQQKQPTQYITQPENIKQEHAQPIRPQQFGMHTYQQHQGVTSTCQAYPPPSHHAKQPSQPSVYPTKPHQESDAKKTFQLPTGQQHQQSYGYAIQQQQLSSYTDHQIYLNKTQTSGLAPAQVSYPTTGQQTYSGYTKDQSTAYPQQQHGYQVSQQVYSGQQYQGYLSQQYQAQPYHGYPVQTDHKGQSQTYQGANQLSPSAKNTGRVSHYEQNKQDQDMPPPPPQKPPPKQDQEHHHQSSKRSTHRYNYPYKREHHTSSSSKSKFSEKHSSSHDDHSGSGSSRHHYHSSSKSSHSKGSSSGSSSSRQSRYH